MTNHSIDPEIIIEPRFRGPPASGNGGYVCGRLADYVDGCARVRLSMPPPLSVSMQVVTTAEGLALMHEDRVIAQAWPNTFELDVPDCPALEDVRQMSKSYPGFHDHAFPGCFVCGPEREDGDGLRVFSGPSPQGNLVAGTWIPDSSLCNDRGLVRRRYIWSVLDCPSFWAFAHRELSPSLLGELSVRFVSPEITAGQELVVVAWELEFSGRKHRTASALFNDKGELLACGLATWIEIEAERISEYVA